MQLKRYYHDCNIVTVPIDAPEGVLGALTGVAGPEKPEKKLVSELQSLAQHLARSLTFCKCKSDLQVLAATTPPLSQACRHRCQKVYSGFSLLTSSATKLSSFCMMHQAKLLSKAVILAHSAS